MVLNNVVGGRAPGIATGITVMVLLMAAPAMHTDGCAACIGKG